MAAQKKTTKKSVKTPTEAPDSSSDTPIVPDRWIKCIAKAGNLKATAITGAGFIEEARSRHKLGGIEQKILGEALLASLLLASNCKQGERVSLSIKGSKFLKQCVVDADPNGTVRGFLISGSFDSDIDPELGPWQDGLLSVVRLKSSNKEPYVGTVPLVTGYLAKDLTFYLSQSEQVPSAVGLTVNTDSTGKVTSAGAFLLQAMPGATPTELDQILDNISQLQNLSAKIATDSNPTKLLAQIFNDMSFVILDEKPLRFECNCSRERVERSIRMLGKAEIQDMIEKDNGAEICCDFCGNKFNFNKTDLENIL